MAVDGAEVADVHPFEDVLLLGCHRFYAVGEAYERFPPFFVEDAHLEKQLFQLESQLVVAVACVQVEQILLHAAHAPVDGHIIVVEDIAQLGKDIDNYSKLVSELNADAASNTDKFVSELTDLIGNLYKVR